jgi:UDP-GlcNAc:undecaprenyl-phosphate GlcNAc-1-phosphate transferase
MTQTLRIALTLLIGLTISAAITPLIIFLAHRHNWYDERNHRKIHVDDTPRLGGVGIFVSLVGSFCVAVALGANAVGVPRGMVGATAFDLAVHFLPIIGGMVLVFLLGLVDDFIDLRAVLKLVVQILAAVVVTLGPFRIESITVPFAWYQLDLGWFSYPVTVLWIVAITNAINFIDGVDGLAGGTAAIAALFFTSIAVILNQDVTAIVAAGLFGALLGFLVYNMPRARIFMGDSGSYVVGFALAMMPLILADSSGVSLDLIPGITILLLPIADLSTSILRRIRRGKHPFSADRDHIHHKLIDLGFTERQLLLLVYAFGIITGIAAVAWYFLPQNIDMAVVLVVWVGGVVAFARLHILRTRKLRT